ncbi:MAG: hypothetical protein HY376_04135 [Candidatus Blackburnbacteria bacterium]|nr:hypothetical protein [Candidatus Blackburnbacteria bacterium]
MLNFFKKHWLLILLALLATLLTIVWIQGKGNKTAQQPLPNLPSISYPSLTGQKVPPSITFNLTGTNLPTQVSLYQITPKSLVSVEAKTLAKNFGFPENPSNISTDSVLGDYYLWLSGSKSLSVRLSPLDINYVQDPSSSPPPADGTLPNEQTASNFIQNLLSTNDLSPQGTVLVVNGSRKTSEDNILELKLDPTVRQTKVVDNNPTTSLITAYLGKDGKVYSLLYKAGFLDPQNPTSYPAKTLEDIKGSLIKEGKIVTIGQPTTEPTLYVPTSVNIIRIDSALLFYPSQPNTLYPIYILTGTAKTNEGDQPVYLYTPAVNSKYINN